MGYTKRIYLAVFGVILLSNTHAQLIKPCLKMTDKFTGKTTKTFFANLLKDVVVGGGVFGSDTLVTIAITGTIAEIHYNKFASEEGDSCIIIHQSGERTRLIAKSKVQYSQSSLGTTMGISYFIDLPTLQDFIKDPPTDIGLFGKPYHIPIAIPKFQQKLIPKAITCYLEL